MLTLLLTTAAALSLPAERPNVVVLYADDLGYGDVSAYNPERGRLATPGIDRMAAEGMRFTDAHSSSSVCSPSRYTLLTGRYHWRSRLQSGIVGLWDGPLIAEDRMTLGSLAQDQGYRTACIGKWHLGWDWPIEPEQRPYFEKARPDARPSEAHQAAWEAVFSQPIGGGPVTRGFGSYFGTDVPNWPPYCFLRDDRTVGVPSVYAEASLFARNQASLQGPAVEGWSLEPILPALGDEAVAFVESAAAGEEPFLLYLSLTSPHTPLAVHEDWRGKSGLGPYGDFVLQTDALVGRVLEAVDATGEDTLVLFTSDNGCAPYVDVAALVKKGHHPSGHLRGYKSDAWEGGHRVPFLVRWPGRVEAGSTRDELVHQADLLRTLAELWEAPLPENAGEDSFSLLPLFLGGEDPVRDHAVSTSIRGLPAFRLGDWKLIPGPGSGGWTKGSEDEHVQLYDLVRDPAETRNRAIDEPERVQRMQAVFEALIARGRSTPGEPMDNDVPVKRYPVEGE